MSARAIKAAPEDSVHQVAALVDDPVELAGDSQEAEAGTLGIRFADGTSAYIRLADWNQPWLTEQDVRSTKRALAHRLGVRLEKPDRDAPAPTAWRPAGVGGPSGMWIARIGNIVPGLLVLGTLVAVPIASWSGADSATSEGMVNALLLVAAACSLMLVVFLWARWLLGRAREGTVEPNRALSPSPKDTVDERFMRTARLLSVDSELCVRGRLGEELWLGGPDDDFGVRTAEVGPGFRWEEPHRTAVNLLDGSRRAVATLDHDDWFGGADGPEHLAQFLEKAGVVMDPQPTQRKRAQSETFRCSARTPGWLWSAGLADTEMLSIAGVAGAVLVAGLALEMPSVSIVAAVPMLLLVVPALVRTAAHHLWLKKPAERA